MVDICTGLGNHCPNFFVGSLMNTVSTETNQAQRKQKKHCYITHGRVKFALPCTLSEKIDHSFTT